MPAKKPANPVKLSARVVGDDLHFITSDGAIVKMPLNIKLPVLRRAVKIEGIQDSVEMFDLISDLAGPDADELGILDIMPLFDAWTTELGKRFGGATLGESQGSSI